MWRLKNGVQIVADLLCLDIADNGCLSGNLEIRRALILRALRLVLDLSPGAVCVGNCLKQGFKRAAIGVLRLFGKRMLSQRLEISLERFFDRQFCPRNGRLPWFAAWANSLSNRFPV